MHICEISKLSHWQIDSLTQKFQVSVTCLHLCICVMALEAFSLTLSTVVVPAAAKPLSVGDFSSEW